VFEIIFSNCKPGLALNAQQRITFPLN